MIKVETLNRIAIFLLVTFIGIITILIWFSNVLPSGDEQIRLNIESYNIESYSGIVIDKYIDKEQHYFKKVIIKENNRHRTILFDSEMGTLYSFIRKGDSIAKENGSFDVHIKRAKLDTVIRIKLIGL